jgi:hypothetical protein
MGIRIAGGAIGTAVFACSVIALAQTGGSTPAQGSAQKSVQQEGPITLVGCIQRESDYRREHSSGRGGVAATGAGLGNEFVLVNASEPGAAGSSADCSSTGAGEAYELTGSQEGKLRSFVGRRVEITGVLKKAELEPAPAGTAGGSATRPTGGFDPLGQDLKLREVNIRSFREAPARAASANAAPSAQPQAAAEPSSSRPSQQTSAAGTRGQLPRTASPLPLAGLIGLFSLVGALGLRLQNRRP